MRRRFNANGKSIRRRKKALDPDAQLNKQSLKALSLTATHEEWPFCGAEILRKIVVTHSSSLSCGGLTAFKTASNSIPTKERDVAGPQVLSGAMGTPKYEQNSRKLFNCCCSHGAMKNKWSHKCNPCFILNFVLAIHPRTELNVSKVLQELEQPMGMQLS